MLRSIMNHTTYTTDNIMKEMPNTTYLYRAICNRKNKTTNILIGANQYEVLDYSDEECMNNKVQNVRFDNVRE